MSLFTSKDPAGVVGRETAIIFTALASGAVSAHMNGLAAMRQAREGAASHQLRYQLDHAIEYAHQLVGLAAEQAAEIESLKAENARLKAVARDRHAAVVRLSARKAA
ncbi:conjugal transfer/entry exclusion protein [Sinorhizobium fredii]